MEFSREQFTLHFVHTVGYVKLCAAVYALNELRPGRHFADLRTNSLEALFHGGNRYLLKSLLLDILSFGALAEKWNNAVNPYFSEFFHKPFHPVDMFGRGNGNCDVSAPEFIHLLSADYLKTGAFGVSFDNAACVACAAAVDYFHHIPLLLAEHSHAVL